MAANPPYHGRVRVLCASIPGVPGKLVRRILGVLLGVQLPCLVAVVLGVKVVGVRDVGVMRGLLVMTGGVRLGGGMVVPCCVLMMRGRLLVVLYLFLVRHVDGG